MPIGSVDYISTVPWNDPKNPWPACSRLTLSAEDYGLGGGAMMTYDLITFQPQETFVWAYQSTTAVDGVLATLVYEFDTVSIVWDGDVYYYLTAIRKDIPAGWIQGNEMWQVDAGDNQASLSIIADTTYLTPWEQRRRRLLEIV